MNNDPTKLNCILAKIAIVRHNKDDYEMFNVHELDDLDLSDNNYHKCRFFEVGGYLMLQDKKYKIKKISCRINPVGQTLMNDYDINDTTLYRSNAAILVGVVEVG